MSDYLTHLAARALGVAETARPHRSIFEPRRVGSEPLVLEPEGATIEAKTPAEPPQGETAPRAARMGAPPGHARAAVPGTGAEQSPVRARARGRAPGRAPRVPPVPSQVAGERTDAPEPPAPSALPEGGARPTEPAVPPRPARPALDLRAEPPPLLIGARPPRPFVPRKEAQPPTVRVTIGRVEVRAVTAEPRPEPKKKTRHTPRMSLEEYLSRPQERSR